MGKFLYLCYFLSVELSFESFYGFIWYQCVKDCPRSPAVNTPFTQKLGRCFGVFPPTTSHVGKSLTHGSLGRINLPVQIVNIMLLSSVTCECHWQWCCWFSTKNNGTYFIYYDPPNPPCPPPFRGICEGVYWGCGFEVVTLEGYCK